MIVQRSRLLRRVVLGFAGLCVLAGFAVVARHYLKNAREETTKDVFRNAHKVSKVFVPTTGPLRVNPSNPRYFTDNTGKAIFLAGSHTWLNFQDAGHGDPPPEFHFTEYLDFLNFYNHNFFRLWRWENSRWALQTRDRAYWFYPQPWKRTGPGYAEDGKPKWNLDLFDESYFERLYERCESAHDRGLYTSIMLFDGWAVAKQKAGWDSQNPWRGHPFKSTNNVNGVNGDLDGDDSGEETHITHVYSVWKYQEAFIKKVIDTVDDLDNVLFEISNESPAASKDWQYRAIDMIKDYESGKPKQHPVGMTSYVGLGDKTRNEDLF
jgi:hypothetical protein